ncbi:MAG TPA: aquaporin [Ilumatobacteraceae bacterium]|nr:aquaporin [Ilumatobacteraceae bacterium]HRB03958.1 aquaporin [Ilumatobacteraceae bacterium]
METQNNGRILVAEMVGTLVLMLGGPGVAIFGFDYVGVAGVAAGFGLSLAIMMYVIRPISGCHINPAVTLGMFLAKKVNGTHAVFAVIGQLIGAITGGAIILGIASGRDDFERGSFAANLWSGPHFGVGAAIITEVILTAILVMVLLFTTTPKFAPGFAGLVAGLTLMLIHLIAIPIDGTSVNPARSLGTALFAETSTGALEQLWVFIVFPLIGAIVGVVLFLILDDTRLEDTLLADVPGLDDVRDALDKIADEAVDAVQDAVD